MLNGFRINNILLLLILHFFIMRNVVLTLLIGGLLSCNSSTDRALREAFQNPPDKHRPMPFWHINGALTTAGIEQQISEAKQLSGYGGVAVLPVSAGRQWGGTGFISPGTEPAYLSNEYFDRYEDILRSSEKHETEVILYDDIDFPSGSAGGRLQAAYPEYTRKSIVKDEIAVKGPKQVTLEHPGESRLLMAVSAMNTATCEVMDLGPFMKGSQLSWNVPAGEWLVMFFSCRLNAGRHVDYMQPEAVDKLLSMTYDEYAKRFSRYFGNVVKKTFYDDVGVGEDRWTPAITAIFEKKYGKNPALYYPALFYDIGPETQAARVAFLDIRSELMAEGYVRKVAEWSAKHNLLSMGHPPENYSPNTVVASGDILKYYRHTQIPLLDAIFFYGRGLHGFKQISSAADLGDKPEVAAEIYGAFQADMDSLMLYRVAMEVMARGVNFIVPHGMWYNPEKEKIRIPPLVSWQNPLLGESLPYYSTWVARSCMLLHGGSRVSDIALLWPITAIQAETYIYRDRNSGLPVANWLPPHVNHHDLSNLLTNELRRDFTFVHPEDLHNGKIVAEGKELILNNTVNIQRYKVLLLPGGEVISVETLKAAKNYYDGGGKLLFTASLPSRSAEFGRDDEIVAHIKSIFGIDPVMNQPAKELHTSNTNGGEAAFVPDVNKNTLTGMIAKLGLQPDISFDDSQIHIADSGYVNYIHKQKEGKEIYFFSNSSDTDIKTGIRLRGVRKPELWNPYTGTIQKVSKYDRVDENGEIYTRMELTLPGVSSIFVISDSL